MCRCLPGTAFAPFSLRAAADARTSFTRVLFPEPETPVTQVRSPTGNRASIPRRLCSRASRTVSQAPSGALVAASFCTESLPARKGARCETRAGCAAHSAGVPWNSRRPPLDPRLRAELEDLVGGAHRLLVVLNDDDGVAAVP